uniref:hypothetical protein n=1 Tax=Stenotrophomonas sp. TaxID=69392 RepID=UPI00289933AA
ADGPDGCVPTKVGTYQERVMQADTTPVAPGHARRAQRRRKHPPGMARRYPQEASAASNVFCINRV